MNLNNLSTQGLSEALAWTLLHSIWQAIIIAGILAIVLHFMNKSDAKLRYLLASIGILLIFISATLTFFLALPDKVLVGSHNYEVLSFEIAKSTENSLSWAWLKDLLSTHVLFPILLRTWLVGVVLLSLKMVVNYIQALRIKKSKVYHLNDEHLSIAKNLLKRFNIKTEVVFRESALVDSPSLVGYFKPVILLPVSLISGIPNNQLEIIIAHELAHISRHDYFVQFIQGIIEILFFYHPMVWWLSSVVNTEREHICDDLAVKVCGESLTLIKALNNMESIRKKKPELVLNFSGKKGNLLHRVRRIINPETVKHPRLERGLLSVLFVLVLSSMVLFSNLANSKNQTQLEPMHSTNFVVGDFDNNEIPQASPINLKKKKKKVKKNQIAPTPPKVVEPIKHEVVVAPEMPELPELPIVLSDTIKVKEVQKETLEEALKELGNVEIEINEETITELEESLKELESIDINIEKELIEAEAKMEIDLKEFEKFQENDSSEEIDNNKNLSEKEKIELKERIKSSLKKINSEEFRQEIKESLERGKKSLQRQLEKMKSGEFQKNIEIQKEKIKEMIEKFESPEFQQNLKENLERSHEHIKERLKEIESPEFQKELKKKIKKTKKKNKKAKIKFDSKNAPLCLLNGIEISNEVMNKLDPDKIESISVLKDAAGVSIYGVKGENGVILIQTKSAVKKNNSKKNKVIRIKGKTKNPPLFVIDGVEYTGSKTMKDIDSNDIKTINVLKDDSAIDKYGKKAKHGAIEITTKK